MRSGRVVREATVRDVSLSMGFLFERHGLEKNRQFGEGKSTQNSGLVRDACVIMINSVTTFRVKDMADFVDRTSGKN